ncbi:MAG: hypothetical protein MK009_05900 [Gammaproteobacteria bacterium]|nr:hypothetical protein [Gammaproteobacteria bacterium]
MVEVTLDGYKYYYHKSEEGNYWLGKAGYKGSMGRYSNCRVPTALWKELHQQALDEGYSPDEFITPVKEKKTVSKRTAKKKDKNSISIF